MSVRCLPFSEHRFIHSHVLLHISSTLGAECTKNSLPWLFLVSENLLAATEQSAALTFPKVNFRICHVCLNFVAAMAYQIVVQSIAH
jgi:hypothetical protein